MCPEDSAEREGQQGTEPSRQKRFGGRDGACKQDLAGFWSNSDSEFSQKINAQDGSSNSCLQKTGSEHFALELDSFGDETPSGDWFSMCSLYKVDGLLVDE